MAYCYLKQGDHLPTVAAMQVLLNQKSRAGLATDGKFGGQTKTAVMNFQKSYVGPQSYVGNGVIDKFTYDHLVDGEDLQIIDVTDVTNKNDWKFEVRDIQKAGGNPVVLGGMSYGMHQMIQQVQSNARYGRVMLLRFHGHGSPGYHGVASGLDFLPSSQMGLTYVDSLANFVSKLQPIFHGLGSVELHGCSVGLGEEGRELLQALCKGFGVPVSAGIETQYPGGEETFRFEGLTRTFVPSGVPMTTYFRDAQSLHVPGVACS